MNRKVIKILETSEFPMYSDIKEEDLDNKIFVVKDLETGETSEWTIDEILAEINRDHSEEFTDYDRSDWREGWEQFAEGDYITLVDVRDK